jgi:acetoin utilization deacetylase AcuC-like enzyme
MLAFDSTACTVALPDGHPFPMDKYARLRTRVGGQCPQIRLREALPASAGELALAHAPGYVEAVAEGWLSAAQQREIGFPWSPGMAERARRSVGATIAAARAALFDGEGVAANLAGGTHHADVDGGSGYCVFNDTAVAARLMQAEWHRRCRRSLRVAVIDLDVHQGNGTAAIFRGDDTVYTLSIHGTRNFPVRKQPGSQDVDLPDGCGDEPYLEALDRALDALWRHHGADPPGLVFYLAGADPHEHDRLGRLKLTTAGLAERDRRVVEACGDRGIPMALSMAGGYGRDIDVTVGIHLRTLAIACESWCQWNASTNRRQAIA